MSSKSNGFEGYSNSLAAQLCSGSISRGQFRDRLNLLIIQSVIRGRARMQYTVTPSPTQGKDSGTDGQAGVVVVALCCGESGLNCPFAAAYQLATLGVCPVTKM